MCSVYVCVCERALIIYIKRVSLNVCLAQTLLVNTNWLKQVYVCERVSVYVVVTVRIFTYNHLSTRKLVIDNNAATYTTKKLA